MSLIFFLSHDNLFLCSKFYHEILDFQQCVRYSAITKEFHDRPFLWLPRHQNWVKNMQKSVIDFLDSPQLAQFELEKVVSCKLFSTGKKALNLVLPWCISNSCVMLYNGKELDAQEIETTAELQNSSQVRPSNCWSTIISQCSSCVPSVIWKQIRMSMTLTFVSKRVTVGLFNRKLGSFKRSKVYFLWRNCIRWLSMEISISRKYILP